MSLFTSDPFFCCRSSGSLLGAGRVEAPRTESIAFTLPFIGEETVTSWESVGTLPSWANLNTSTGEITATPDGDTPLGVYSFTVQANTAEGSSTKSVEITVTDETTRVNCTLPHFQQQSCVIQSNMAYFIGLFGEVEGSESSVTQDFRSLAALSLSLSSGTQSPVRRINPTEQNDSSGDHNNGSLVFIPSGPNANKFVFARRNTLAGDNGQIEVYISAENDFFTWDAPILLNVGAEADTNAVTLVRFPGSGRLLISTPGLNASPTLLWVSDDGGANWSVQQSYIANVSGDRCYATLYVGMNDVLHVGVERSNVVSAPQAKTVHAFRSPDAATATIGSIQFESYAGTSLGAQVDGTALDTAEVLIESTEHSRCWDIRSDMSNTPYVLYGTREDTPDTEIDVTRATWNGLTWVKELVTGFGAKNVGSLNIALKGAISPFNVGVVYAVMNDSIAQFNRQTDGSWRRMDNLVSGRKYTHIKPVRNAQTNCEIFYGVSPQNVNGHGYGVWGSSFISTYPPGGIVWPVASNWTNLVQEMNQLGFGFIAGCDESECGQAGGIKGPVGVYRGAFSSWENRVPAPTVGLGSGARFPENNTNLRIDYGTSAQSGFDPDPTAGDFTVFFAWKGTGRGTIVCQGNASQQSWNCQIRQSAAGADAGRLRVRLGNGGNLDYPGAAGIVDDDQLHIAAVVGTGTGAGNMTLYLDDNAPVTGDVGAVHTSNIHYIGARDSAGGDNVYCVEGGPGEIYAVAYGAIAITAPQFATLRTLALSAV